jgi:hypothetical protein
VNEEKTYEAVVFYVADSDDMANHLYDDMLGAIGCTDDREHTCPHFRLGFGPLVVPETRKAALARACREIRFALGCVLKGF